MNVRRRPLRRPRNLLECLTLLAALTVAGCGRQREESKPVAPLPRQPGQPDVAFVTTPDRIVDKMIEMAEIQPDDVVYDLGCGDGRIVIAAAKKHGVKAIGVEIDPKVVEKAKENVKQSEMEHLVTIRQGDVFETDFRDATVVMMYLLPELNVKLMPKLAKLKKGTRIVSHSFDMKGARPEQVESILGKKLYLWRVPFRNE